MVFDCGTDMRLHGDDYDPASGNHHQLDDFVQQVFRSQVVVFPKTLQQLPLQETLRAACASIQGWLQMNEKNGAVILAPSATHACALVGAYTLEVEGATQQGGSAVDSDSSRDVGTVTSAPGSQSSTPGTHDEMETLWQRVHSRLRDLSADSAASNVAAQSSGGSPNRSGRPSSLSIADAFRRPRPSSAGANGRSAPPQPSDQDSSGPDAPPDEFWNSSLRRCLQTFSRIGVVQSMRRATSVLLHPCPPIVLPSGLRCGFVEGVAPRIYSTTPTSRQRSMSGDLGSPSARRPSLSNRFRVRPSRGPPPSESSSSADGAWVVRRIIFNGKPRVCKKRSQSGPGPASNLLSAEGFRPYVSITQEHASGPNLIYSSMVGGVREYGPSDRFVEFNPNSKVRGEIVLKVFHVSRAGGAKKLFEFGMHTDSFGAELFSAAPKSAGSPRSQTPTYWVHIPPFGQYVSQTGTPLPSPRVGNAAASTTQTPTATASPSAASPDAGSSPSQESRSRSNSSADASPSKSMNSGYFMRLREGPGPTCLRHVMRLTSSSITLHDASGAVALPDSFSLEVEFEYRFAGRDEAEDARNGVSAAADAIAQSPSSTNTVLYQLQCDKCSVPFCIARPAQLVSSQTDGSEHYNTSAAVRCPHCKSMSPQFHAVGGDAVAPEIDPSFYSVDDDETLVISRGATSAPSSRAVSPQRSGRAARDDFGAPGAVPGNGRGNYCTPPPTHIHTHTCTFTDVCLITCLRPARTLSEPSLNIPESARHAAAAGGAAARAAAPSNADSNQHAAPVRNLLHVIAFPLTISSRCYTNSCR